MTNPASPTPDRIMEFAWGYSLPLVIEAAVRHHVFDVLDSGPRSVADLAKETGASERGLTAILNVLVGFNLLAREGESYSLTPESSAFLVAGKPAYHGMLFQHMSSQIIPTWLHLPEVVSTGRPAMQVNQENGGTEFFVQLVEAIFPLSFAAANALGEHLKVAETTKPFSVLDIGAGSGVWGIALALQSPQVRIHAVDWPGVLEVTQKTAARHGVAERLSTAPGDFFEADFGQGHDVCTIGHILHSEGRERSRRLLKKVYDSLTPGGVVAIQEFVPNNDRKGPPVPLIFAVNMLVNTEAGDTFTFAEMSEWLLEAGFKNPRLLEVPSVSPLVLADKA